MENETQRSGAVGSLVNQDVPQSVTDPDSAGSGSPFAPGGANAPQEDSASMTHGQESYPGYRPAGDTAIPGETPAAGDVDPASTASAEETGQDGDPTEDKKKKALPWN